MIEVPDVTSLDLAFGNTEYLPKWSDIPDEYKNFRTTTIYEDVVSTWFYEGITAAQQKKFKPRSGVVRGEALAAIGAILASFEPKHEHKLAGAAYLMSEWFEITEGWK